MTNHKITHVDCTDFGGYTRKDPCNKTCLSDTKLKDNDDKNETCPLTCKDDADFMSFRNDDDRKEFIYYCV
jgi:hypothetical protein